MCACIVDNNEGFGGRVSKYHFYIGSPNDDHIFQQKKSTQTNDKTHDNIDYLA